jgi:GDSL-like lipase/acylhydrolase family protein
MLRLQRKSSQATAWWVKFLLVLVAALFVAGAGAGIAVITAGGSSSATPRSISTAQKASRASAGGASHAPPSTTSSKERSTTAPAPNRGNPKPAHDSGAGSLPPATKGAGAFGPVRSGRTSCRSVVHIGDSTSEGLDSSTYLPKRSDRIGARYSDVGVATWKPEISGATSIVETLPGGTNAHDVAQQLVNQGYRGCWVIALGTNDSADVAVGSAVSLVTRIQRMMSVIGNQPVVWVNVKTLVSSGPYAETNMEAWDNDLVRACARYPNMRVFDWASVVKDGWYIPDGIHFTSEGYAARARLIADALAKAFPASGASTGCVVR